MWWFLDFLRAIAESKDPVAEAEAERNECGVDSSEVTSASTQTKSDQLSSDVKQSVVNPHLAATEGVEMAPASSWFQNCFRCFTVSFTLVIFNRIKICQFQVCCGITYILCPPVPCCIVRKAAFHPPKKGQSYKLLVKDADGDEKYVSTAKEV